MQGKFLFFVMRSLPYIQTKYPSIKTVLFLIIQAKSQVYNFNPLPFTFDNC